jgi:hypothetical protein
MRTTLPFLWATLVLASIPGVVDAGPRDDNLVLENAYYRVEVGRATGTIVRVHDRRGGMELLREPRLADNFRFTLPLRGPTAWQSTEANYLLGKDQPLSSHREGAGLLELHWDGPMKGVDGRPYEVAAVMAIRLVDEEIRFEFRVENHTAHEIGEVFSPVLGGCLGLGDQPEERKQTQLELPAGAGVRPAAIFHTFTNHSWLGVIGPEQFHAYPETLVMPWLELFHPQRRRGFYFGAHDPVARYKVLHLEMFPGTAGNRAGGNWPRPDERGGLPEGVKIALVHMPYQPAGQTFEASPVVLRFHDGDWRAASRIYGDWFTSRFDLNASRDSWSRRTAACQECRGVAFRDWPRWAETGARSGVRELLIAGWGREDDRVPRFEPDPRLGTRDELAAAIRRCHELGVQVTLDVRVPPVPIDDEWYLRELERYACRDRWGIVTTKLGWGRANTLTQQFGTAEHRALLNPGVPGLRQILVQQFRNLAELGIDGVHLHDLFARPMDFNPATGKTPDRASCEGALECIAEIQKAGRDAGHPFDANIDPVWDRTLLLSQVTSAEASEPSSLRAAFPWLRSSYTVAEPDDFGVVNEALRLGGRLRVAPANLEPMGGAAMADLAGYVRSVLGARQALRATLGDGEPLGTAGLALTGGLRQGVFRDQATGLRTAVVVNPSGKSVEAKIPAFETPSGRPVVLWRPSRGACKLDPTAMTTLEPDELVLVTEEPALERLAAVARWTPARAGRARRVVFDLRSAGDLEGWKLDGAFALTAIPNLSRTPTLNSLAAGEGAVGTATSPTFVIDPAFDRIELLIQGGTSSRESGRENLAVRFLDARTGEPLAQVLPPSTHLLVVQQLPASGLTGKPLRIELVDSNRASSYAWIGLRRVALLGKAE